jgi:hypothetical protein
MFERIPGWAALTAVAGRGRRVWVALLDVLLVDTVGLKVTVR